MLKDIAVDSTHVYWLDDTTVMKIPKDGGSPITLASNQSNPGSIAVDSTSVYWTDFWSQTVKKVPKNGGLPTVLASYQDFARSVLLSATHVYWTGDNSLMRLPKDGGTPFIVSAAAKAGAIDSAWVYWGDSTTVWKMPLGGGTPIPIAAYGPAQYGLPHSTIAVDATSVYWADNYNGTIMKVSKDGTNPITLVSGENQLKGIAIDSENVYWGAYQGAAFKMPLNGGVPSTIFLSDTAPLNAPVYLAVDCTGVYIATTSSIVRVNK